MGTTTIELAKKYGCQITAVDLDKAALAQARLNGDKAGVGHPVVLFHTFSFPLLCLHGQHGFIEEKGKAKCMEEYYRVLKPGGVLLTHDVMLKQRDENVREELSRAINVNVGPLTEGSWIQLARSHAFDRVDTFVGEMTLMSLRGMIYDEGLGGTLKICFNALKKENYGQFMKMLEKTKSSLKYFVKSSLNQ